MKWLRVLFFVVVTVAVTAPGAVWGQPFEYDALAPGSVLVFPKFETGTVASGQLPRSAFEINVICPDATYCSLPGNNVVTLHANWVCPGNPNDVSPTCLDTDFVLFTTVNGTIWIDPQNVNPNRTVDVPPPPCQKGFLVVWVVQNAAPGTLFLLPGTPISYNGLTGDAVWRPTDSDAAGYNAIAIQSVQTTGNVLFGFDGDSTDLSFDSSDYNVLTYGLVGGVHYENANTQTFLVLLTLDVDLGNTNPPTNVQFKFYNEGESPISINTQRFVCWEEVELKDINPGLTTNFGHKGLFTAETTTFGPGTFGTFGLRSSLLGLVETIEVTPGGFDPVHVHLIPKNPMKDTLSEFSFTGPPFP